MTNIIVCTLSIGEEYKETVKYATLTLSKEKYCEKHKYTFVDGEDIHYKKERAKCYHLK